MPATRRARRNQINPIQKILLQGTKAWQIPSIEYMTKSWTSCYWPKFWTGLYRRTVCCFGWQVKRFFVLSCILVKEKNKILGVGYWVARYWAGLTKILAWQNIEVEDWSKEILVGQADAWTSQLVVSAKLIMEIVWMRTPQPSAQIIFNIFFWRIQCTVEKQPVVTCGRRRLDSRPLWTWWWDWWDLPTIVWSWWVPTTVVETTQ